MRFLLSLDTKERWKLEQRAATSATTHQAPTSAPRKLIFTPSPAPLPKAVTTFDGSHQGLRPFTAALLVHLGPLTTWILESAPAFAISI